MMEYVDHNLTTKRDWTNARKIHRKRLVEIVRTPSRRLSSTPQKDILNLRSRQRDNSKNYAVTGKIAKENSLLRCRITQVSPAVNTNRARSSTPRLNFSLYGGFENKEKNRVKKENQRMAQRIIQASPSFTVKQWKQQYKQIEKIKRNICKPHILTAKFSNLPVLRGRSLQSKKISEFSSPQLI